ncbi:hypothetical protein EVAR_63588_1 [Eumeta japonica]|uniref:Uncharacterized protein n=1 Tax=Eumeta variegata TaxID=151549 RepID=A0A4C1ZNV6_EUMVA|nr:hypothetical protein EVAR_63588_1 [Eumeta japonica]
MLLGIRVTVGTSAPGGSAPRRAVACATLMSFPLLAQRKQIVAPARPVTRQNLKFRDKNQSRTSRNGVRVGTTLRVTFVRRPRHYTYVCIVKVCDRRDVCVLPAVANSVH